MELITPRLRIREFRSDDIEALLDMELQPDVQRFEGPLPTPDQVRYKLEGALEWAREQPRTHYKLAITIPPETRVRGRLSLSRVTINHGEWEIGWTLHPAIWKQGYATEGARALLGYAFHTLNAQRVIAFCQAENTASLHVMERLGMRREEHRVNVRWLNNAWHDEYGYVIQALDFHT